MQAMLWQMSKDFLGQKGLRSMTNGVKNLIAKDVKTRASWNNTLAKSTSPNQISLARNF